jgi:hypothetical protein
MMQSKTAIRLGAKSAEIIVSGQWNLSTSIRLSHESICDVSCAFYKCVFLYAATTAIVSVHEESVHTVRVFFSASLDAR